MTRVGGVITEPTLTLGCGCVVLEKSGALASPCEGIAEDYFALRETVLKGLAMLPADRERIARLEASIRHHIRSERGFLAAAKRKGL